MIKESLTNVSAFSYDSFPLVTSGDVAAAHWYVGATVFVQQNPDVLAYYFPPEGATMYQEDTCVLKNASNADNAKAFLEFYFKPEIAALNVKQKLNGTPDFLPQDLIPPAIPDHLALFRQRDLSDDIARDYRRVDHLFFPSLGTLIVPWCSAAQRF